MRSIQSAIARARPRSTCLTPHRPHTTPRRNLLAPPQPHQLLYHSQNLSGSWSRRCVHVNSQAVATAVRVETKVKVSFKLPYRCHFGQNVYLIGAGEELGNWNVGDSKRMKWSDGDIWAVDVELGAGRKAHQIEYKYVVLNPDGGISAWKPGNNCKVEVSDDSVKINVFDAWDGAIHDVQVMLPRPTPQDFTRLAAVAAATAPVIKQTPPGQDVADVVSYNTSPAEDLYDEAAVESEVEDITVGDSSVIGAAHSITDTDFGIGTQLPIPNPLAKFEPTGSALDDFPITTRWLYSPPKVEPPTTQPLSTPTSTPTPNPDTVTSFPIDPVEEIEGYAESIANFTSPLSSSTTWGRTSSTQESRRRQSRFGSLDTDDDDDEDDTSTSEVSSSPPAMDQPSVADIGGLPSKPIPPPVFAPSGSEESATLSQLAMVLNERNAVESAMKRALQEIDLHLQESMDLGGKLSDPAHETRLEMDRKLAAANMRVNAYTKVLNACPPVKELQAAIELERKESQP